MSKDIIAPFIFAIGCFVFFWLDIPQYDNILDVKAAIKERQVLLTDRVALRENTVSLMQQYETRKNDIDKINLLLPSREELDQIIEGIQTTASQNGVSLVELNVGLDNKTDPNYALDIVKINISASVDSAINFMKEIEKSLRIYDITEMAISQSQTPGTYNIEFKVNTYSLK